MRKIILILFFLFGLYLPIEAEEKCMIENDWSYQSLGLKLDNSDLIMAKFKRKSDGSIGFCLEPSVLFVECSYYNTEHFSHYNLEYIAKIIKAYQDLGATNNLYIAAQLMIWDALGSPQTINGDSGYNYGRADLEHYINTHFSDVNTNIKLEKEVNFNEYYKGEDLNHLLNDHFHLKGDNLNIIQDGNTFNYIIKDIFPLNKQLKVIPNIDVYSMLVDASMISYSDSSQNIMRFNGSFPILYRSNEFTIRHKAGDLVVHKLDEWGSKCTNEAYFALYFAKEEDNTYKVLKEIKNEYDEYFKTHNGDLVLKNTLPPGLYALKEISQDNYLINEGYTYFEIKENQLTEFNYFNENKTLNLNVIKLDQDNNALKGARFELYDISSNLDFDADPTILKAGHELIIENTLINQVSDSNDYPKESLYFFKNNSCINLYDYYHLMHGRVDIPLKFEIIQNDEMMIEKHLLYTKNNTYFYLNIKNDQYPNIKVKLNEEFEIYEDDIKVNENYLIQETSNTYHIKAINKPYILAFDIQKESLMNNEEIDISFKSENIDETYKIYVQAIDEKIRIIDGLKLAYFISEETNDYYVDKNNHALYHLRDSTVLFKGDQSFQIDLDNGRILNELEPGIYHDEFKNEVTIENQNTIHYPYLKHNRHYLLCEVEPPIGYGYTDAPCIFFDTKENRDVNLVLKNELREITFNLYKENHKEVLLNGAIFEVTNVLNPIQAFMQNIDHYKKRYITGGYIFNNDELYEYLVLIDANEQKTIYTIKDQKELVLRDLKAGYYKYYLTNDLNETKATTLIKVIDGGFCILNHPYNEILKIKEIKAPSGYFIKEPNFDYVPNLKYGVNEVYNHRLNSAIIVVNTACGNE